MKASIIVILFCICNYYYVNSQEEFFGNQNGLSFNMMTGSKPTMTGVGLSTRFNNGIFTGIGHSWNTEYDIRATSLSLGFISSANPVNRNIVFGCAFSYGFMQNYQIGAIDLSISKLILNGTNFPLAIGFGLSAEKELSRMSEPISILSVNYKQAFCRHWRVYPVIGVSRLFDIEGKIDTAFGHIGLNVNLGSRTKMEKDKEKEKEEVTN